MFIDIVWLLFLFGILRACHIRRTVTTWIQATRAFLKYRNFFYHLSQIGKESYGVHFGIEEVFKDLKDNYGWGKQEVRNLEFVEGGNSNEHVGL
jgi:hypothetical protein